MKQLVILFLFISCSQDPVPTPTGSPTFTPTPTEQETIDFKGRWNNTTYDTHLIKALVIYGRDLLEVKPTDWKDFSNSFPETHDERVKFWAKIIVEMAYYESGWKTFTQYKESFKDQKGEYIISRGLLQLSIESAKGYGCPLPVAEYLHDPKLNLECGVRILNRWVSRDKRIAGKVGDQWLGGARYWSVLRQNVGENKKSTMAIKAVNK